MAEDLVGPTETILAIMEWTHIDPLKGQSGRPTTLVVTQKRLWSVGWALRFSQRRPPRIKSSTPELLVNLGSVSETRKTGFISSGKVAMELRWNDGRNDLMESTLTGEASEFIRALRDASEAATQPHTSPSHELAALAELRNQGLLTAGDWERAKNLFLGKPPDERESAIRMLRQLDDLRAEGILSNGEFNMKKWDVLSRTH